MKFITTLLLSVCILSAAEGTTETGTIVSLYEKGAYADVCKKGVILYYRGNNEPHFAAMVGMACAKVDEINPLGALQRGLVDTPALRRTATYFAALVLEKRLLYQHFIDGLDIEPYTLPKYDHILSIVFDHVSRGDYKKISGNMLRIDDKGRQIFVSVSDDDPVRILVDEYNGAKRFQRHWFQ
jgi:hypothetical protein